MKRATIGTLVALATLLFAGTPAQASASSAAQKAVRKAVQNRYDAPKSIAVRCHHRVCEVAFRQASSTCTDPHVRVTKKRHVHGLHPRCTDDSAPGGSGETAPPPPATDVTPPPAQGDAAPSTTGPPPLPTGPPLPPPSGGSRGVLAHTSGSNSYEWSGWTNAFQWDAYPGYWFAEAVWHDQRDCEPYYADFRGVFYWDGSQWQGWYGYWKNWWFGDTYATDPCIS